MQLTNELILPASVDVAWHALNDPEILRSCIPGCESLLLVADSAETEPKYEMLLGMAVGPVKAKFKGKMTITNIIAPASYSILFEGQGGGAGHGKGDAHVRLEVIDSEHTRLRYEANAAVGGKIAQVGSRLVDMAAKKLATDFFEAFNQHLKTLQAAAADPTASDPQAEPSDDESDEKKRSWWQRVSGK